MSINARFTSKSRNHNPGIYKIVNQRTGATYIGSSTIIQNRFYSHKNKLINRIHPCSLLQKDYTDGDIFTYDIIVFCHKEFLSSIEKNTIKLFIKRFGENMIYNDTKNKKYTRSHSKIYPSWAIPRKKKFIEEIKSGVYSIKSIIDDRIQYIGCTNNFISRRGCHLAELRANRHSCAKLQEIFNLIGEENIAFTIEIRCSTEEMKIKEENLIRSRSDSLSDECILNNTKEYSSILGIIRSDETKSKMSEARRRTINSGRGSLKGYKHSEEAKKNMSGAQKGRIVSQKARQNMSESHKGKKVSLDTKRKRSESLRKYNEILKDKENEIISKLFNGIFTK